MHLDKCGATQIFPFRPGEILITGTQLRIISDLLIKRFDAAFPIHLKRLNYAATTDLGSRAVLRAHAKVRSIVLACIDFWDGFCCACFHSGRVKLTRYGFEKAMIGIHGVADSERIFLISSTTFIPGRHRSTIGRSKASFFRDCNVPVKVASDLNLESLRLEFFPVRSEWQRDRHPPSGSISLWKA